MLVCTTIVESRPGHPQRQHADRRARRPARPVPAAPAAWAGRPLQRAGLRLLPLPAGHGADRDRLPAAGDGGRARRLGSGLQIALRDLEIRGAGNVVGAEQSGQVAAVGFDMYAQLLKEEVADLNGTPIERGGGDPPRPAGRRPPPARLRRRRQAAPGAVQAYRRRARRCRGQGRARGARGPLRAAAAARGAAGHARSAQGGAAAVGGARRRRDTRRTCCGCGRWQLTDSQEIQLQRIDRRRHVTNAPPRRSRSRCPTPPRASSSRGSPRRCAPCSLRLGPLSPGPASTH